MSAVSPQRDIDDDNKNDNKEPDPSTGKGYKYWRIDPNYMKFGLDSEGNGLVALNKRHAVAASVIRGRKYYITHHAFDRFMERAGDKTKGLFLGLDITKNVHNAIYAMHTLLVEGKERLALNVKRKGSQHVIASHHWCFVLDSNRGTRIVTCYPEEKENVMSAGDSGKKSDSSYTKGWKKATREKAKEDGFYDGRFAPKTYQDQLQENDKYLCRQKIDPLEFQDELEMVEYDQNVDDDDDADDADDDREDETVKVYNDGVSFSPFKDLLKSN